MPVTFPPHWTKRHHAYAPSQRHRRSTDQPDHRCRRCGKWSFHWEVDCHANSKTCFLCGQLGHLASCCFDSLFYVPLKHCSNSKQTKSPVNLPRNLNSSSLAPSVNSIQSPKQNQKSSKQTQRDMIRKTDFHIRKYLARQLPFSNIGVTAFHDAVNTTGLLKDEIQNLKLKVLRLKCTNSRLDLENTQLQTVVQEKDLLSHQLDNKSFEISCFENKVKDLENERSQNLILIIQKDQEIAELKHRQPSIESLLRHPQFKEVLRMAVEMNETERQQSINQNYYQPNQAPYYNPYSNHWY